MEKLENCQYFSIEKSDLSGAIHCFQWHKTFVVYITCILAQTVLELSHIIVYVYLY